MAEQPERGKVMRPDLRTDSQGFPMVWMSEVGIYVHCFPITKVQFEAFLSDGVDGHFHGSWYAEATVANPRIATAGIDASNYWHALMTGVTPGEAWRFARWAGAGYRLPLDGEWDRILQAARPLTGADSSFWEAVMAGTSERSRRLVSRLWEAAKEAAAGLNRPWAARLPGLVDLGVMEWVRRTEGSEEWVARGAPHPALFGNLFDPARDHLEVCDPNSNGGPFGFRLVYEPRGTSNRDESPQTDPRTSWEEP